MTQVEAVSDHGDEVAFDGKFSISSLMQLGATPCTVGSPLS